MDPNVDRLLNEILQLINHLERETIESQGYARKGDYTNTLRNTNESRDELQNLVNKWQQLNQLLQSKR